MSKKKKIVYVAHPISGDVEGNLDDLARILRIINLDAHPQKHESQLFSFEDVVPQAPYYADIICLNDNNALERKRGIDNDVAMIESGVFDELWLTGDKISFGMSEEVKLFLLQGKPIIDYTNKF